MKVQGTEKGSCSFGCHGSLHFTCVLIVVSKHPSSLSAEQNSMIIKKSATGNDVHAYNPSAWEDQEFKVIGYIVSSELVWAGPFLCSLSVTIKVLGSILSPAIHQDCPIPRD